MSDVELVAEIIGEKIDPAEAMFRAAALAPLHCPDGKKLKFKKDEFFKIVLEQTDSDGPVSQRLRRRMRIAIRFV
jgi:hypothetical protein